MRLDELTKDLDEGSRALIQGWLERGDGVAVYENVDLGHPELGHLQFVSFGSPEAMLPGEPPSLMPDIGTAINWRYTLKAKFLTGGDHEVAMVLHLRDVHGRQLPECFDLKEGATWANVHRLLHELIEQTHEEGYR